MELRKSLERYVQGGTLAMHMPGHKRKMPQNGLPWSIDITEISGMDNLHGAQGILKEAMERAAAVFGAGRSFFLVNGSTAGVLAGICAATKRGDEVLMTRGSHKSVYNALELRDLKPHFIPMRQLDCGAYASIDPKSVEEELIKYPDVKLLIVTSPTYEGVESDLKTIVEIAHKAEVPVIVDAAHGAHFGFAEGFPESAVDSGADIVVHGVHKTLPSLTQTALLHFAPGRLDEQELERQLSVFQTSSPSYPLMASLDSCIELLNDHGAELFGEYKKALCCFDEYVKQLRNLSVLSHGADSKEKHPEIFNFDSGKIVIVTQGTNITGRKLLEKLRDEHNIELEMALGAYAIAMTSVCDGEAELIRLAKALLEIDSGLETVTAHGIENLPPIPQQVMSAEKARAAEGELVEIEKAEGLVSGCMLWAYPPGIPLITPGERVSSELIEFLKAFEAQGVEICGEKGAGHDKIWVLKA